ncbi:MFS transporter [Sandarakinorhabdus sp.]|uniref:MFS transporter n=1 Tax=Sandarakinorhabdus sp. TaxID=1916663 RepID=UPI00334113B6
MFTLPAPLQIRDYRAFWLSRFFATVAGLMLVIVIGWQVYDIARASMSRDDAAFLLGMIGLAQFLPLFCLALVVGVIADRMDRRHIARAAVALEILCAAVIGGLALAGEVPMTALFVVAALLGVARAFQGPSMAALAPNLVPRELLPQAIALNSISWQAGAVIGPPLGAFLYAVSPATPYLVAAVLFILTFICLMIIRPVPLPPPAVVTPWRSVMEGISFVRHNRVVLGAISLDLFAVLLGGATAMLPVYARDVLDVGVAGLGPLRAAPSVGAVIVAVLLANRPLRRHVGPVMFASVAVFGLATVVFGLSTSYPLSLAALFVLGAADAISVFVRGTLIQLHTPDDMRGRVSSVSGLFISASNELGELESGLAARYVGAVPAVVAGGIGAVLVTLLWAWRFPQLRTADRFAGPTPKPG